ncbi:flippase [Methylocystis heyeri]|uniref:flippase n=1 Tax=Methylocystis heyeri TaxID=391905 RepID=UPI001389BCD8|nr:flippase [Methylocystis heyeri]
MSIRKHTGYNLLGSLLPIGVSLLTVPVYIRLVGDARYGVLALVWSLLGYFSVFNFGLGRATAQRLAAIGGSSPERAASVFWTAVAMNGALGAMGGLLLWPVSNYFLGQGISMDAGLKAELGPALPWLMLSVPLMTLSVVFGGALQGYEKFLELNIIAVATAVLAQLLPLLVAWKHGPDLTWLLASVILTRLFLCILLFWRCRIHVLGDSAAAFSRDDAKSLFVFGGWVTVTSLVSPLLVVLDRFVIGSMMSASAVTYYVVPFQLAERATLLPSALTQALFPRFAADSIVESRQLATLSTRALAAVTTPAMIFALLVVEPFFRLWIGPEFASNAYVTALILLLAYWINGLAYVPYTQLQAAGRPDLTAKCHLVELLPYLAVLFLGLRLWGIPGAAVAFALRTFGDWALLMWFAGALPSGAAMLRIPAALLLGALSIAVGLTVGSASWWAASVTLLTASLAWAWRSAPAQIHDLAAGAAKRLFIDLRWAERWAQSK